MAFPSDFEESNCVLSRPDSISDEECGPLCVCRTVQGELPVVVSCWKLTAEELAEINRTGRVWLGIVGETMPPAWIAGHRPFSP